MNKKSIFEILFKAIVLTALAVVITLQVDKQNSIVYVDAMKLVNGYKGFQSARKELEFKSGALRSNLDTLKLELEGQIKEYETKAASLSKREKMLMEELIKTKQEQYVNYQNVIAEKIQKEDQE